MEKSSKEDHLRLAYGRLVPFSRVAPNPQSSWSTCPVCQEELDRAAAGSCFVDCNHWYHFDCLSKWVVKAGTCPMCKKEVSEILIVDHRL